MLLPATGLDVDVALKAQKYTYLFLLNFRHRLNTKNTETSIDSGG